MFVMLFGCVFLLKIHLKKIQKGICLMSSNCQTKFESLFL